MSEASHASLLHSSGTEQPTIWTRCILCQSATAIKGPLVLQPRLYSYHKLLETVAERASLHDGEYIDIQRRLQGNTRDTLLEKKVVWHRACYSSATTKMHIQRARDRMQHSMSTGSFSSKKRGQRRTSYEKDEA